MSSTAKRDKITKAQKGICFYCNKPLYNSTIEHIVPRAVHKWTKEYLDESEYKRLRRIIQSRDNLAVVHASCNVNRGLSNVTVKHLSPEDREFLKPKIRLYNTIVQDVLESQGHKCYSCGKYINGTGYPRRRVSGKRVVENCAILCFKCNINFRSRGVRK